MKKPSAIENRGFLESSRVVDSSDIENTNWNFSTFLGDNFNLATAYGVDDLHCADNSLSDVDPLFFTQELIDYFPVLIGVYVDLKSIVGFDTTAVITWSAHKNPPRKIKH